MDRSLTSTRTVTDNTSVSDTEDEMASELESPAAESDWELLSDRDPVKADELDQEHSEEANYRETMRGVHSFMGRNQIPDLNSSSPINDNPFAGFESRPSGKYPVTGW